MKSKETIATEKGESIMTTSSFEKDFIVTDKQAPLWEKAIAHFENKKIEWTPVEVEDMTIEEIDKLWEKVKS
jgi:hypothetical protein